MKALGNEEKRVFIRLKKSSDFQLVLNAKGVNSLSFSSHWFESKLLLADSISCLAVGFTVGKRFAFRAVDRNLVKRILRESVRNTVFRTSNENTRGCSSKLVIRLKRKLPTAGKQMTHSTLKKMLRDDADAMLLRLMAIVKEKSSISKND